MKKITWLDLAALVVWLLPVAYLLYVYPSLPQSVPLHFDLNGNVNRYGSKSELIFSQCVLLFVSILVYFLLKFLPAIDPKKTAKYSTDTFQKTALGIVLFLSILNINILFSATHHGFRVDKVIFPVIGLLFAFLGNVMYNIKPNYFVGFRTPWALENGDNWRATHRVAGKMWFIGGIVITILTLLLPGKTAFIVFLCGAAVMVIIPFSYSYRYYKNHQVNKNS